MSRARVEQSRFVEPTDQGIGLVIVLRIVAKHSTERHDSLLRFTALEPTTAHNSVTRGLHCPACNLHAVTGATLLAHRSKAWHHLNCLFGGTDVDQDGNGQRRFIENRLNREVD